MPAKGTNRAKCNKAFEEIRNFPGKSNKILLLQKISPHGKREKKRRKRETGKKIKRENLIYIKNREKLHFKDKILFEKLC